MQSWKIGQERAITRARKADVANVDCPLCGAPQSAIAELRIHLIADHRRSSIEADDVMQRFRLTCNPDTAAPSDEPFLEALLRRTIEDRLCGRTSIFIVTSRGTVVINNIGDIRICHLPDELILTPTQIKATS